MKYPRVPHLNRLPVTPHAGVRIEINRLAIVGCAQPVTPHAGVRIEIFRGRVRARRAIVTPHAGVRIEIIDIETYSDVEMSPPTRGCELKYALAM